MSVSYYRKPCIYIFVRVGSLCLSILSVSPSPSACVSRSRSQSCVRFRERTPVRSLQHSSLRSATLLVAGTTHDDRVVERALLEYVTARRKTSDGIALSLFSPLLFCRKGVRNRVPRQVCCFPSHEWSICGFPLITARFCPRQLVATRSSFFSPSYPRTGLTAIDCDETCPLVRCHSVSLLCMC